MYTTQFSNLPQYTYANPLTPTRVLQSELELIQFVQDIGDFDGVLGYSGGAAFAAQAMIRHSLQDSTAIPLFRFAIFINGGTPLKAFNLEDELLLTGAVDTSRLDQELEDIYLRPSNLRVRKGDNHGDAEAAIATRKEEIKQLTTGGLKDGRLFVTDGKAGLTRYAKEADGVLINIPTLHIRCLAEEDPDLGLNLLRLCDPYQNRELFHEFGHDFPRGAREMRKIAEAIIELSELA